MSLAQETTTSTDQTQTKPASKCRRWQIVAFVLVFVSLCSWWYWPRGDARFVGKWELTHEHTADTRIVFTLYRNGLGSIAGRPPYFPWLVRGNQLIFGEQSRPPIWWMIHDGWTSITGQVLYFKGLQTYTKGDEQIYEILSASPEKIRLQSKEMEIVDLPPDSEGNRSIMVTDDPVIVILTHIPE